MNWNWIKSLKRPEWTKFEGLNDISRVGGWGVIFIALVSFVLSYAMLQNLAAANGFWGWQSFLWPLTLDAVVVVSALSVLRKSLHGDKVWILEGDWHEMDVWAWFNWDLLTAWGLVFLFSFASIAFNVIHAYLNLGTALACVMAGLPPFVLLCAVEVQVRDVQGQLRRSKRTQGTAGRTIVPIEGQGTDNGNGQPMSQKWTTKSDFVRSPDLSLSPKELSLITGQTVRNARRWLEEAKDGHSK